LPAKENKEHRIFRIKQREKVMKFNDSMDLFRKMNTLTCFLGKSGRNIPVRKNVLNAYWSK